MREFHLHMWMLLGRKFATLSALAGATAVEFYTSSTASAVQVTTHSLFGTVLDLIISLVEGSYFGEFFLVSVSIKLNIVLLLEQTKKTPIC